MIKKKGQISRLSFQQQKNKGTNTIFFFLKKLLFYQVFNFDFFLYNFSQPRKLNSLLQNQEPTQYQDFFDITITQQKAIGNKSSSQITTWCEMIKLKRN
jgi:hypothetical protein